MVVGGAAIRVGGVIGPAYRVAVGLDPGTMARTKLGEGTAECPWWQLFGWVNWRGGEP